MNSNRQLHIHDLCFFCNATATTEIYTYLHTLSLHDALPILLLPITLTFAATAALLNLLLAIRVSRLRVAHKILHGDGGNVALARRMRAHANYIEYTTFILILAGLVELARGSEAWLWIVALVYIVCRALHAFGMDQDFPSNLRPFVVLVTWATLLKIGRASGGE